MLVFSFEVNHGSDHQIKGDTEADLKIIFLISHRKHML